MTEQGEPLDAVGLRAIRERWEKATPGPWQIVSEPKPEQKGRCVLVSQANPDLRLGTFQYRTHEVEAIAHAPTDIAALLGLVEEMVPLIVTVQAWLNTALPHRFWTDYEGAWMQRSRAMLRHLGKEP